MNCYVCHRLKAEGRIARVRIASLIVEGYSACDRHAADIALGTPIIAVIERERNAMRRWFQEATDKHGEFNEKRQRFADKVTLVDAGWPWHVAEVAGSET
jgi:endonuclease V-like protein UPF0215 family